MIRLAYQEDAGFSLCPPRYTPSAVGYPPEMFLAAFTSRSWTVPHAAHVHTRTCSGLGPSFTPHAEQTCDVGSNRPIRANVRPYWAAFPSISRSNCDQPASCTDLASRVRASPDTHKSSA